MERARKIVSDVIAALELARRLKFEPLLHDLLESSQGALEEALYDLNEAIKEEVTAVVDATPQPVALPPSPQESLSDGASSSGRRGTRYTEYSTALWPFIRQLYPDRPHKENVTEGAKLWKLFRHLDDLDQIIAAAKKQAMAEAPPQRDTLAVGA